MNQDSSTGHVWAVVLAGGEGVRLRPLIRRLYGQDRPKQFAALVGSRCLLHQTLDRVRLAVAPEHTVVVIGRNHEGYLAEALDGMPVRRVLMQPEDKGTAAGIMLPGHWINWRDPEAIIAVFPSDHFIKEEQVFMEHVAEVAEAVRKHPEWMVLLGVPPTEADPDYGWIEPGEILDWSPAGEPISTIQQFREKPSPAVARACLDKGWLWNTFVVVAKASLFLELGAQFLPQLHERLSLICPFKDTELEPWAFQQAYRLCEKMSFSRAVLERCPPCLVVSRFPALTWSDWGTPERVVKSLRKAGLLPSWFGESDLLGTPVAETCRGREEWP
jgi:mannose-1-phosphate guanylyltransferase